MHAGNDDVSSRVLKYSRLDCLPLINNSIAFGLECWTPCLNLSSISEVASLLSMLTHCLQSRWFEGGL